MKLRFAGTAAALLAAALLFPGRVHGLSAQKAILMDAATGRTISRVCETRVHFVEMTQEEIRDYVSSGEPLDKAGAYGIQGRGGMFVDRIEGSYSNVVGLPMTTLREMLQEIR